jgi:hypothetical protein
MTEWCIRSLAGLLHRQQPIPLPIGGRFLNFVAFAPNRAAHLLVVCVGVVAPN